MSNKQELCSGHEVQQIARKFIEIYGDAPTVDTANGWLIEMFRAAANEAVNNLAFAEALGRRIDKGGYELDPGRIKQ